MKNILKYLNEKFKKILLHLFCVYTSIKGFFKVKRMSIGDVYFNEGTLRYYKYLGGRNFVEGNKIIDTGFLVMEVPGNKKTFTYLQIGLFNFLKRN